MRVANFHRCFDRSADGSDFVVRAVSDEAAFNASKTGIFDVDEYFEAARNVLPVMPGATIVDNSGRTRSGQTIEAFFTSVEHAK